MMNVKKMAMLVGAVTVAALVAAGCATMASDAEISQRALAMKERLEDSVDQWTTPIKGSQDDAYASEIEPSELREKRTVRQDFWTAGWLTAFAAAPGAAAPGIGAAPAAWPGAVPASPSTLPPPFAAAPGMPPPFGAPAVTWHLRVNDQNHSADSATVLAWIQAGHVKAQVPVWREGLPGWSTLGQMPEFAACFVAPSAPGMPPPFPG